MTYEPIWFSRHFFFETADGERDYARERERERLWNRSRDTALPHFMRQPQPDLTPWEVDDPATAAHFEGQPWIDETHRFRCLYHLRQMALQLVEHPTEPDLVTQGAPACDRWRAFGHRLGEPSKKWSAKECADWWSKFRITADRIDVAFQKSRCRPLEVLADEGFDVLCRYDQAVRNGGEDAQALVLELKTLLEEANGGTRFGVAVNNAPNRLRTLWKWKARAEGKLPMYGLRQKFRFECRGMHVIASTEYGLALQLDPDKHKPGDLCWSNTGYRSFVGSWSSPGSGSPEQWARSVLEDYIDAPKGKDGMGGMNGWADVPWIPMECEAWHDRMIGRTSHPQVAEHYNNLADRGETLMQRKGVDPYTLFPDLTPPRQPSLFGW